MRGAVDKIGEMPMNAATTWNKKYPNKYAICLYCNSIYYQSISPESGSQCSYVYSIKDFQLTPAARHFQNLNGI